MFSISRQSFIGSADLKKCAPFNLLDDFKEDEIYTWDYVMEQRAKASWDLTHFGDPNPYASLPTMNIYTYDLGRLLHEFVDEDVAFNFREFFRVNEAGKLKLRRRLRDAYAMLTHSVHSRTLRKGFTRAIA